MEHGKPVCVFKQLVQEGGIEDYLEIRSKHA